MYSLPTNWISNRMYMIFQITAVALLLSCSPSGNSKLNEKVTTINKSNSSDDSAGTTVSTRFSPPEGYTQLMNDSLSFGSYLQSLPLKPMGTDVRYYNGESKLGKNVYCSVIDMDIDPIDLQQCADAVMRLRGEYLYYQKRYSEIKFNFLVDGKPRYYIDYAKGDYSYTKFRKYMKYIFSYANTASLKEELKVRSWKEMQIGDVFIQKGNPYGHAVIVVNMAKNSLGEKCFMLAQSYMPAQETQILINPSAEENSPWYKLKEGEIITPEWRFTSSDLRCFD